MTAVRPVPPRGARLPGRRLLAQLLAAVLLALGALVLAGPAAGAAERLMTITADGLVPGRLVLAAGDTVVLVNDDASFRYRATSTTDNWTFDSGLLPLPRGQRYRLPQITESGAYGVSVFQGEAPFNGVVELPAPGSSTPRPVGPPPASPTPAPTDPASPAAPTAGPGASPAGAPTAGASTAATVGPPAVAGDLPGARTARGYGLPSVLAVVLAGGVLSLLVRLLLAEPVARLRAPALPSPVVTSSTVLVVPVEPPS